MSTYFSCFLQKNLRHVSHSSWSRYLSSFPEPVVHLDRLRPKHKITAGLARPFTWKFQREFPDKWNCTVFSQELKWSEKVCSIGISFESVGHTGKSATSFPFIEERLGKRCKALFFTLEWSLKALGADSKLLCDILSSGCIYLHSSLAGSGFSKCYRQ